jgi:hypothetical protein
MRRRERWLGLGWLQWMGDDRGNAVNDPPEVPRCSVATSLATLTGDYRRYVDMEREGEAYVIRVLPANPGREVGGLAVGLKYSGMDLAKMLATAVVDLDLLAAGTIAYRVGANERERWVP